ncbi:Mitochondrial uncoupling protein 5 [Symbiodinium microadriaticum]|uniref:Mitochondrial uncoupling protein 5 n=1 Tax=Symbiodinium microadriaticum TaxID=2951 RepID=A0A1Q9CFE5_SYMMI|nr:Mitochondrial uncoupling protein 5 [Symbiodinium microadriaticum]
MSLESRDDLASELLAATQDEVGETPLFEALEGLLAFCITAAAVGNSEIVSLLLLSSANPNHISHQEMVARFSGREVDPKETEAATSTLSASLQSQVLDHIARTNSPSDSKAEALSPPHGQLEPATGPEDQEPKTDIGPVGDPSEPTGQEDSDHPPSPAGEAESKEPEMQRSGAVPEPTSPGTPRAEREGAAQVGSLTGSTDPARPDQSEEQEVRPPEEQTEVRPDESVKAGSATEPGPKPLSSLHVIEHSPMVAVRSQPWMQSPVIAHLRPGQHVNLGEWDATQQWRRVVSEDGGWLPVWHPTLGCLVTLVGVEAYPLKRDFDRLPGPSVSEVWEELYSNGCLNVPPPEHTETGGGGVGGTMAAKALMEVMTMGRAQTSEGEMALARLSARIEPVIKKLTNASSGIRPVLAGLAAIEILSNMSSASFQELSVKAIQSLLDRSKPRRRGNMASDGNQEKHLGMEARLPRTPAGETKSKNAQIWKGFVQGSVGAAIGGSCAHPLDLIKVRMQLQTEVPKLSMLQMGPHIVKNEGVLGLFKGVDASAARQLVYSGVRFGMYDMLKGFCGESQRPLSTAEKVICAAVAGATGAFAGNPGDLAMVRMQADGKLPEAERRGYKNIFDAVGKIARSEGVLSMWRTGVVPNMNRATIITVGQLAAYDTCKEVFVDKFKMKEGVGLHLSSSFGAAFIASVMSNPVDVAKTRLMNQKAEEGKPLLYRSTVQTMSTIAQQEGPLALYKGFPATFARQCPYVVITWVTVEQLKKIMKDW